jgi:peptidyl-prolyl cis-trans isomerase SurA
MIFRLLTVTLLTLGLVASLTTGLAGPARAEVINRIVAEVNNDVITLQDLEDVMRRVIPTIKKKTTPQTYPQELARARQFMLAQLIIYKLEEQQFKKLKLSITKDQIDRALKRILARNKVTLEQFLVRLKKRNETLAAYRLEIRRHLIRQRLMRIVTRGRIIITEQEIRDFFEQKVAGRMPAGGAGGVHLAAIIIPIRPGAKRSEVAKARRLANQVYARLKKGADFTALARKYNPEGLRENGGDLGTVQTNMMRPQMARLVAGLAKGQVSRIMKTARGFQIIKKLGETRAAPSGPAPTTLTPQIKNRIRAAIFRQKMQQAYQKWLNELRGRSHLKITL